MASDPDWLRKQLTAERKRKKWSLARAARAIAKHLGAEGAKFTKQQLHNWETPRKGTKNPGPRVDQFMAWAQGLGLELEIDLSRPEDGTVPVRVSPDVANVARGVMQLNEEQRRAIAVTVDGLRRQK